MLDAPTKNGGDEVESARVEVSNPFLNEWNHLTFTSFKRMPLYNEHTRMSRPRSKQEIFDRLVEMAYNTEIEKMEKLHSVLLSEAHESMHRLIFLHRKANIPLFDRLHSCLARHLISESVKVIEYSTTRDKENRKTFFSSHDSKHIPSDDIFLAGCMYIGEGKKKPQSMFLSSGDSSPFITLTDLIPSFHEFHIDLGEQINNERGKNIRTKQTAITDFGLTNNFDEKDAIFSPIFSENEKDADHSVASYLKEIMYFGKCEEMPSSLGKLIRSSLRNQKMTSDFFVKDFQSRQRLGKDDSSILNAVTSLSFSKRDDIVFNHAQLLRTSTLDQQNQKSIIELVDMSADARYLTRMIDQLARMGIIKLATQQGIYLSYSSSKLEIKENYEPLPTTFGDRFTSFYDWD